MAKRKSAEAAPDEDETRAGFHPRLTNSLFGHESAEDIFLGAFNAGSLHHAWLLTGERGIGKASFAYRAARFLLSREGAASSSTSLAMDKNHPVSRQIAAQAHPSLFVLGPETMGTASIGVDAVRGLRGFLALTSPGGWRAMIVDPANDLTIASANALLKAIEEPPPLTVFFLISHGASQVMPTIRSRSFKLALRPLNATAFQNAVEAACSAAELPAPSGGEMQKLFALAAGSPGRAMDMIAGGVISLADKLERIMAGLPKLDHAAVHHLVEAARAQRNADTFEKLCDLIEERIEEQAKKAAAECAKAAAWAELWRSLRARRLELDTLNLDKGAFLVAAFSDMERVARNS